MLDARFCRGFAVLVVVGCLGVPVSAGAQEAPRIGAQIGAGGVDLSGLTVDQAAAKLDRLLVPRLNKPVVVRVAGKRFELDGAALKVRFSSIATARRALALTSAAPTSESGGTGFVPSVELKISHAHVPVKAFAAQVAAGVGRPAQNATLEIGVKKMHVRRAKLGVGLDQLKLAVAIDAAVDDARASRLLKARVVRTRPTINANDLRRINNTVITVEKSTYTLRLFKHLKLRKTYQVAIGQPIYPTPAGLFRIQNKQVNPVWSVPNSPWAGELGGSTVAGGSAANPLKARWMGITDGVGIHGTGQPWSVGSAASHGCLRMRVPDVIDLFPRVPVGTPVLIR